MDDDAAAILAHERDIAAAHLRLDKGVIERLYHSAFRIPLPGGGIEGKADVLASWATGERHWESAAVDQLEVVVEGGTGIVTGRWRAAGSNSGQAFDYAARFLSVWVKVGGDWQNIAYQSAEIPMAGADAPTVSPGEA